VTLGEYLGIFPRFADTTNIGGSAFEAHVAHAAMAIEAGYCDVALIVYGSMQKSERSRTLGGRPPVLTMQFENVWGIPQPVGGYALAAQRHMHELPISDPLKLLDCCLVTDGAGAVVMTTADNARAHGSRMIHVRGYGEAHTHWSIGAMPDLARLTAAEMSSRRAFEMAGIDRAAIDVVECYDSFTITVLMTLEALGFCKPGEGGAFVSGQRTAPGGPFPLNTNGGGLSYCHPGMYGIFLLVEAVRQLRGDAGDRQVAGARTALVHGTGGTLSSGGTVILANH
jgi:acetyl-CoA acetyltransferase